MIPIGYWKGSGLSILLDMIATVLTNANSVAKIGTFGDEIGLTQIMIAIDPTKFQSAAETDAIVDAIAADLGVAKFQIASNEGDYVILDEPISTEQYAIGFLKGNTELRDAVNAELLKMAADGTMLEIAQKYVDQGLVLDSLCLIKK